MSLDSINQPTVRPGTLPVLPQAGAAPPQDATGAQPGMATDRALGRRKPAGRTGWTKQLKPWDANSINWAAVPAPKPGFAYQAPALPNVDAALTGDITGAETNEQIVDAYAGFDKAFSQYLGNPPIANWTTFGKYAAREAGQQIVRLETVSRALSVKDPSGHAIAGAIKDVVTHPGEIGQCGKALVEDAAKKSHIGFGWLAGLCMGPAGIFGIVKELPHLVGFVGALLEDMKVLHKGLMQAHVGIYNDFAPAFDTFLQAESKGQDGVAAVKGAIASGRLKDPNGLLVDALTDYQQAAALGQQAQALPDGPQKDSLLAQREALVKRGTLLIGVQEQYGVAQPEAFGDPAFKELIGRLSPFLQVHDANGAHDLQKGGNWADFATRMGFVELPAAVGAKRYTGNADPANPVVMVHDDQGKAHYYQPNPNLAKQDGTIYQLFDKNATGQAAVNNIHGTPPKLEIASVADDRDVIAPDETP